MTVHVLTGDTMVGKVDEHRDGSPGASVHGVRLVDVGSCELPDDGHTITLAEWRAQQPHKESDG